MDMNEIISEIVRRAAGVNIGALLVRQGAYELTVSGEDGGIITAMLTDGRLYITQEAVPGAVCRAVIDKTDLEKLLTGGAKPLRLAASGRIKLSGDVSCLPALAAALAGAKKCRRK